MKRACLILHVTLLGVTACTQTELEDCEKIQHESKCEDADVDGAGACHWVEAYRPSVSETACEVGEPTGLCVGIGGTQQGCGLFGCEPGSEDESANLYFRHDGPQVEVFGSPECGPEPVGDWTACSSADAPAECSCLCGVAEPPS